MLKPIKVLIVDDSALARDVLKKGLAADPEIEVVGTASDAYVARDRIVLRKPDVVTLDIEMPKMDGLEFLKRLMPQYPLPVVVVSALAEPGASTTLDALENGALDFVLKPSSSMGGGLETMMDELRTKIKTAAQADLSAWTNRVPKTNRQATGQFLAGTTDKIIAIGASTGGTVALANIIEAFPADMPGTVIVQHMPPVFTKLFAERMDGLAAVEVKEAETGDRLHNGRVLIAPGGKHLTVYRSGGNYHVRCSDGEQVNGHRPSVDVLFNSVSKFVGPNAIGVVLTGMGRDGADGLLAMRKAGARTLAQDKESSVVFGMPAEAYKNGGAERLVNIADVPAELTSLLKELA